MSENNNRTSEMKTVNSTAPFSEHRKNAKRGFAAMSPERQRQIASEGGREAHRQGVAHEWNSAEAREAGRKGGQNSRNGSRNHQDSDKR